MSEWHFQNHAWLYTAVPTFALSLHKQLLGTSLTLSSFVIFASKACKSFMDSVTQYQGTSLGPCPVLWESVTESTQGPETFVQEASYQVLHSTPRAKQA